MSAFEHRGETYYADDKERIYNSDGTLLGYISRSGIQYAWGALKGDVWGPDGWAEDDTEFSRGSGSWDAPAGSHDPAMDAILAAHTKRDAKRDQPSDLMGRLRAWRARHVGYYVLALGDENSDYIGGAFEKQAPYNEAAGFAYLRPPKEIEVYKKLAAFPEVELAVLWRYGRGAPLGRIVKHYRRPARH